MNQIPTYFINIDDEDTYMNAISIVDFPAVEHNFLAFDKIEKKKLQFVDEDKHIISGVVCLADTPIYRRDDNGYEYYIVFTRDVISKMMLKYSQMELFNSVNLQHNDNQYVDSVKMIEFYQKDSEKGINPVQFSDVPEGSLFASYKILDESLWNQIKTTEHFNGFSLEIYANLSPNENPKPDAFEEFINDLLK